MTQRMTWVTYRVEEWWEVRAFSLPWLGAFPSENGPMLREMLDYALGVPPEGYKRRPRPRCLSAPAKFR